QNVLLKLERVDLDPVNDSHVSNIAYKIHLCFAPLRSIPLHSYDDPIRIPSITAGTEFFDVQKATSCYGKIATFRQRCPCDGGSGGGCNSQGQEASRRSNRSSPYLLLPSACRQDPLPGYGDYARCL